MINNGKVIKGLEYCEFGGSGTCYEKECPYYQSHDCTDELKNDILVLLKEQKPKTGKRILDDDDANSWECSECGGLLIINNGTPHENDWHFCPCCGAKLDKQEVKWDE